MAQTRTHDYRGPRSSENLNGHLMDLIPPGVYRGFHVAADGALSAGVLLTAEGIRIEEDAEQALVLTEGHATLARYDLVVCRHEYEKTVPAPAATFEVIVGVASAAPELPALPAFCTLLAVCQMDAIGTAWASVTMASRFERGINCYKDGADWKVTNGDMAAILFAVYPQSDYGGGIELYIVAAGTYADDAVISWGSAAAKFKEEGLDVVSLTADTATFNDHVTLRGTATFEAETTFEAKVNVDGGMEFDADDVASVVFDDWVTFTRFVQPCQANSPAAGGWTNEGYTWKSVTDVGGQTLYVPIHAIVGAELVSVDVSLTKPSAGIASVDYSFITCPLDDFASQVAFGAETHVLAGSDDRVDTLVMKDPVTPFGALPFAFDASRLLWLRLRTVTEGVYFSGCKLNYRRKQIAI